MTSFTRVRAVLVFALLVWFAAACSGDSTADDCPGEVCEDQTELTISPEDSLALAEDDKYVSPAEEFQIAQTLRLTDAGPVPRTLVVIQNREMTIVNESAQPQTLYFVNAQVDDAGATTIGPIAPGGQLSYTPTVPISMAYNLTGGPEVQATLQVDLGDFAG